MNGVVYSVLYTVNSFFLLHMPSCILLVIFDPKDIAEN